MALSGIVDKERKMNRKPRSQNIDIEDIRTNKFNRYKIENIDDLAQEIKENGLYRPLEVYQDGEEFILLGGERRFRALSLLYEAGDIDSEISCLVYAKPESITDERMQIITSNSQRDLDDEQKIEIVKELLEILKEEPERKPKNMPTVEWLAPYLGCSARTAQKYKNKAEGKDKSAVEKKESSQARSVKPKTLKDIAKVSKKFNKDINSIFEQLTDEEKYTVLETNQSGEMDVGRVLSKLTAITCHLVERIEKLDK